jgi:MoaA/NifB/PqqE/SkfB family radical SAM enzyme
MKAKIKPRIELANRTPLESVIPLSVPFIINVDPSEACNFQCKFCPTGDRQLMRNTEGRNFGVMDFELFKKIVDDICEFDQPIKVLRLYKDGEPLLNKNFVEMIRYAKQKKCCARVDTTTNASLLSPEKSLAIIDAGLDRINISIEGINSQQYLNFSQFSLDFERFVGNIRFFYQHRKNCEMIIKINGDILGPGDKEKFYEIFGDIADGIYIESIMSCWPEFELNGVQVNREVGIYQQEIKEVVVCPYVFYSFSINADGVASACYLDWARKLVIGDVRTQSVKQIWNGEKLRELQRIFLRKERKAHAVCANCGQMTHGNPDNIDVYSNLLLKKILHKGKNEH